MPTESGSMGEQTQHQQEYDMITKAIEQALPEGYYSDTGYDTMKSSVQRTWIYKRKYKQWYIVVKEATFSQVENAYIVEHWKPNAEDTQMNDYDSSPWARQQDHQIASSLSELQTILQSITNDTAN